MKSFTTLFFTLQQGFQTPGLGPTSSPRSTPNTLIAYKIFLKYSYVVALSFLISNTVNFIPSPQVLHASTFPGSRWVSLLFSCRCGQKHTGRWRHVELVHPTWVVRKPGRSNGGHAAKEVGAADRVGGRNVSSPPGYQGEEQQCGHSGQWMMMLLWCQCVFGSWNIYFLYIYCQELDECYAKT